MSSSRLFAYLRLFRIANVFTAIADVAMGFVFVSVNQTPKQWLGLCIAIVASSLLYTAGMVLNDAFDAKRDAEERSKRPIPAGEISRQQAFIIGWGMLLSGIVLCGLLGWVTGKESYDVRPISIGLMLAGAIVTYDGILKMTPIAPLAMGSCRFFNVLLGVVASGIWMDSEPAIAGLGVPELLVAGGIGVYIAGVTWFARTEARRSNRLLLSMGLAVMVFGIAMLASFPYFADDETRFPRALTTYGPLLFGLVGVVVVRRCIDAIIRPEPGPVQQAIKQSILSLILFDASVCLAVAPNEPYFALFVLALLGPMIFLGRWIPST